MMRNKRSNKAWVKLYNTIGTSTSDVLIMLTDMNKPVQSKAMQSDLNIFMVKQYWLTVIWAV